MIGSMGGGIKNNLPPQLEVDMIPVFEDIKGPDRVFIIGIEVKFFKGKTKSFCDRLQQVLSFGLFGFDSLVLWHIFSEKVENRSINAYVRPVKEIVEIIVMRREICSLIRLK